MDGLDFMRKHVWDICVPNPSAVCRFAAEEFARLIAEMDDNVITQITECAFDPERPALWIGRDAALPQPPEVEDPEIDDAIRIEVRWGGGCITGVNDRSVLIAVYRFFREAGCVFVRPGRENEFIPAWDTTTLSLSLSEKAAYRHRGICMEGANSYENVVEMIDFAPKLGFNAWFTQLFRPAFTFKRWYDRAGNASLLPTPVSNATIDSFVEDYSAELALRGLIHHRIGHGWASKALGITSGAWHEKNDEAEVLPERHRLIALIGGERKLFAGSGIDTNLCYADGQTRALLADEVVAYARTHPQIRYLHFWLADQANNQCECPRCRDQRPSDQYIEILNLIDERLSAEGLPTKIVFLIYLDLLWPPVRARIAHPERFVLMYAPIRRSYSVPMAEDAERQAAPFVRNGFVLPPEAGGTLPYLRGWQEVFRGDSFVFDYHYMWDYVNDPGRIQSARTMARDVENLASLGLNGMMSCQNLRVFMPDGLAMNLMGEAMWSGHAPGDAREKAYFKAAFGLDGEACLGYLERLSEAFDPPTLRGEKPIRGEENNQRYLAVPPLIDAFRPVIRRNLEKSGRLDQSWACMDFHAELCGLLAGILIAAAQGNIEVMDYCWPVVRNYVQKNELRFQREFDAFEFLNVWENKILVRFRQQSEANIE